MPRPVHFEIHASDPAALIGFYGQVFGWTFEKYPGVDYWIIMTGDEPLGINGGLLPRRGPAPQPGAAVSASVPVIGVSDCSQYHERAMAAGATETMPVTSMPGVGTLAYFQDPDGNHFGIIEPTMPPR
jgi:uncharacterized protein